MKKLLILSVIALAAFAANTTVISSASAQAQAGPKMQSQIPFGGGEQLFYNVSYRATLIPNINLMRVSLRTYAEDFGGRLHYHAVGNGKTNRGVEGIFSLNDTWHIWLDGTTLYPSRMTGDQHENNYKMRTTYNYDWTAMNVNTVRRRDTWKADRYASVGLGKNSGDAFSLFWRLRAIDLQALAPGRSYPLELVLDDTSRSIRYTFVGREDVKIKKLGMFRTLKFTCTMATSDGTSFEDGMTLTVWVSDDANHIPILMDCPIRVGSVRVTLAEDYKVVHPLTSLIK